MTIHRLLYCSDHAGISPAQTGALAKAIALDSARRNSVTDLTGALASVDGRFIQVIEGPLDALEVTFERICCDPRHQNIKLLDFRTVSQRRFARWNMACLAEDEASQADWCRALGDLSSSLTVDINQSIEKMLTLLAGQDGGDQYS